MQRTPLPGSVRRWLLLLSLLLVAALIAAWLLRHGGERPAAVTVEEEAGVVPQVEEPAPLLELSQADAAPSRGAVEPSSDAKHAEPSTAPAELATLAVLVVDANRTPVSRARVMIGRASGSSPSAHVEGTRGTLGTSPITGDDGRVEFEVPVDVDLRLTARGEDGNHGRESLPLAPLSTGERREVEIELPIGEDVVLCVRVLAADDRSPIAGARVNAFTGSVETLDATTDSEGRFQLSLPPWERADVKITARGFGFVYLESGRGHETPERAQVVLLERSATLRARVTDAAGAGIADAVVRLWTERFYLGVSNICGIYLPSLRDPQWKGQTDAAGLYVLEELPPHVPFHVEIHRTERAPKMDLPTLSLSPGEVREVEWSLDTGCRLEGSVVDQRGEVVSGRTIWLQRAPFGKAAYFQKFHGGEMVLESTTDAEGRFAFRDVVPGAWLVGPAAEREDSDPPDLSAIAAHGERIEIPEGVARQEVALRVHRGLYISGRVVDPEGAPAPDEYLWGNSDAGVLDAKSSSEGTFALGPLVPGRYTLVAQGRNAADSEPIEAMSGEEGVVLALRAGGSLSGRVIDETGRGCAARVCFARPDGWVAFTNAGDDGTFRFEGLVPGTYALSASGASGRAAAAREVAVVARADTDGLVLSLEPGAVLRVTYAGAEGYLQCQVHSDGATVAVAGIPAGGREQATVPPGALTVECTWGGKTETRSLEIGAGEERELVFGAE